MSQTCQKTQNFYTKRKVSLTQVSKVELVQEGIRDGELKNNNNNKREAQYHSVTHNVAQCTFNMGYRSSSRDIALHY